LLLFSIIIDITVMALNHGAHGGRYIFALVYTLLLRLILFIFNS